MHHDSERQANERARSSRVATCASLALAGLAALCAVSSSSTNNAPSTTASLVSFAEAALFLEDLFVPLFTNGTTVLTMEYNEEGKNTDGYQKLSDNASPRLGWRRWWTDQFEAAAVVSKATDIDCLSIAAQLAERNNRSDTFAFVQHPTPQQLLLSSFSLSDLDRLLTTTTSIDITFEEINRQMRQQWCLGSAEALYGTKKKGTQQQIAKNSDDEEEDDHNSNTIKREKVCQRDCHPITEVDEVSELSRSFKDRFEMGFSGGLTSRYMGGVFNTHVWKLMSARMTAGAERRELAEEAAEAAGGTAAAKDEEKGDKRASSDLGKLISDAFDASSRKEKNTHAPDMGDDSSSPSPLNTIFTSAHFIDSFERFIAFYYSDPKASEGDSPFAAHQNNPVNGIGSDLLMIDRQGFFNVTNLLAECKARDRMLHRLDPVEEPLKYHHDEEKTKKGTESDTKNEHVKPITRSDLLGAVAILKTLSSPVGAANAMAINEHRKREEEAAAILAALPDNLKDQYLCFLSFYSEQKTFLPTTGAADESELWLMNIGQARIDGLEKAVTAVPYGGLRSAYGYLAHNGTEVVSKAGDGEWYEGLSAAAYSGGKGKEKATHKVPRYVYSAPTVDSISQQVAQQKDSADDKKATRFQKALTNAIQTLSATHFARQHMSPMRQLSHRTGKTVIVRDADGRSAFVRYVQLLLKQKLFGAEASGVDVNVQLVYEPPPKVSQASLEALARVASSASSSSSSSDSIITEEHNDMRFSSQPPRYEAHDLILIPLTTAGVPLKEKRKGLEAPAAVEGGIPITPTASRLLVTLQRSGTHLHLSQQPCTSRYKQQQKMGMGKGHIAGGKVVQEQFVAADGSNASAAIPLASIMTPMPEVSGSCIRPKVDYYTHPALVKASAAGANGEDSANMIPLDDPNTQRVFLDNAGDMLYIPRGMIYSLRTVRTVGGNWSNAVPTLATEHGDGSDEGNAIGGKEKEQSPIPFALDGAVYLSVSLEPVTYRYDRATYASLLQSVIREAYFKLQRDEDAERSRRLAEGIVSPSPTTYKIYGGNRHVAKTEYCHDDIVRLNKATYLHLNRTASSAATNMAPLSSPTGPITPNPFRGRIKEREMGVYSSGNSASKQKVSDAASGDSGADNDNSNSNGGFMKIGRKKKVAATSGGDCASDVKATGIPFPTACFNEVHMAILVTEALAASNVPALRKSVIRIPPTVLMAGRSPTTNNGKTNTAGSPSSSSSSSTNTTTSPYNPDTYPHALLERHNAILAEIEAEVAKFAGIDKTLLDKKASSTTTTNTDGSGEPIDPAVAQKRWSRLILGRVLVENNLQDTTPLWYSDASPFRERMVLMGGGGSGGGNAATGGANGGPIRPLHLRVGSTAKATPTPATTVTPKAAEDAPFPMHCAVGAYDIAKLLTDAGAVPVDDLTLSEIPTTSSSLPAASSSSYTPPKPYSGHTAADKAAFAHYKGQTVVSWKHSNALALSGTPLRDLIVRDIVLGEAISSLFIKTAISKDAVSAYAPTTDVADATKPIVPLGKIRAFLTSIARHKHTHRAGTFDWLVFNEIMGTSTPADVRDMRSFWLKE